MPALKFIAYRYSDSDVLSFLRRQEYDIFYVADGDTSMDEKAICQKANAENYVLLTADEPAAEKWVQGKLVQSGVLVVKIADNDPIIRTKTVSDALDAHAAEVPFAYSVVTKGGWKSKRLGTA